MKKFIQDFENYTGKPQDRLAYFTQIGYSYDQYMEASRAYEAYQLERIDELLNECEIISEKNKDLGITVQLLYNKNRVRKTA